VPSPVSMEPLTPTRPPYRWHESAFPRPVIASRVPVVLLVVQSIRQSGRT